MKKNLLTFLTLFVLVGICAQEPDLVVKLKKEKPILDFVEADILDEFGNFNYADEEKLPWIFMSIANFLKPYNEIIYSVTKFDKDNNQKSSFISDRIQFNEMNETINVRKYSIANQKYIETNDRFIPIDDVGQYADELNFFPYENLHIYRVTGEETIETAVGSYNCTVVEGIGNYGVKYKYWMINEKPGVFARVIEVRKILKNQPSFTAVYELNEIN